MAMDGVARVNMDTVRATADVINFEGLERWTSVCMREIIVAIDQSTSNARVDLNVMLLWIQWGVRVQNKIRDRHSFLVAGIGAGLYR